MSILGSLNRSDLSSASMGASSEVFEDAGAEQNGLKRGCHALESHFQMTGHHLASIIKLEMSRWPISF